VIPEVNTDLHGMLSFTVSVYVAVFKLSKEIALNSTVLRYVTNSDVDICRSFGIMVKFGAVKPSLMFNV